MASHRWCTFCWTVIFLIHALLIYKAQAVTTYYAEEGTTALLTCTYTPNKNSRILQIVWKKNDEAKISIPCQRDPHCVVNTKERYGMSVDFKSMANLTISDVSVDDESIYKCDITYIGASGDQDTVELKVTVPPRDIALLNSSGSPLDAPSDHITLTQGEDSRVGCRAVASRPNATITWDPDGASLETMEVTHDANVDDERLTDTVSWIRIKKPRREDHGKTLTCAASLQEEVVKRVITTIYVEGPPDKQISIKGADGVLKPFVRTPATCVATNSYPASLITWYLDGQNVTKNASHITDDPTSSDRFTVTSTLNYVPKEGHDGKVLKCEIRHVTLREPIVANRTIYICKKTLELSVTGPRTSSSFSVEYSVLHPSTDHGDSAANTNCKLYACEFGKAYIDGSGENQCYVTSVYVKQDDDTIKQPFEVTALKSSTTYDVTMICHHSCGNSTYTVTATTSSATEGSSEETWIRELIFVIIAVIVVSAFVIVVTVTIVLRAVVRGSIRPPANEPDLHSYPMSEETRSRSGSRNLYTIPELNESENKIYQEIKESHTPTIISRSPSFVRSNSYLQFNQRSSIHHPKPPPLPPVTNRASLVSLDLQIPSSNPGGDSGDDNGYMPMSPTHDRVDAPYLEMGSMMTQDAIPSSVIEDTNENKAG